MKIIPVRHIPKVENESVPGEFRIRSVQDLLAGKDMTQELHRHNFFFILAIRKGKGNHTIDFTTYPVADNSVFVMRPGQVHELLLKAGSTGYLMEFTADFCDHHHDTLKQFFRKATRRNHTILNDEIFARVESFLASIQREHSHEDEGYRDIIKATLNTLFVELGRHKEKTKTPKSQARHQELLERLFDLLETHIATHKQPSQYADLMHLSLFQLNSITKLILGKTCSEVITDQIILEAKRYLLGTSSQVNQIAYQLGYDDVSYFIRFFKKQTGYSPETYRQNFK